MDRRNLIEFITSIVLILMASIITLLPIFNVYNVKKVFIFIMAFYGIVHFVKNLLILNSKDYSGFITAVVSIIILIIMCFLDVSDSPWNLALLLFIWIILMSLTKLKESDYYHDRKNKIWEINVVNLVLFIISGIVASINLYYTGDIQILVLGFFFLINGILELMDPLMAYLLIKK